MEITDADAKIVTAGDTGVVVALRWRFKSSNEVHRQYEALRMRDGLVYDMQSYREERAARRALR